jgi:O-antigen/teichoic acid export membrane protein
MTTVAPPPQTHGHRALPPVLGRLLSGTFWLALRALIQIVTSLWTIPLILQAVGHDGLGWYGWAWGWGFLQFLLEFGMSSALQRQVSEKWTEGDRAGVDRAIACGLNFYAAMALFQVVMLMVVAYAWLPLHDFSPEGRSLIVKLLWLQAVTAPCYGMSVVASSVLQAARRYDFVPRLEVLVVLLRFVVLFIGVNAGFNFFGVIVAWSMVPIILALLPAIWVMVHELGHAPSFRGAGRADYRALLHISFYMFLVQLSVVLADKVDTTVLGYALSRPGAVMKPASAIAIYQMVSKPFVQIRQSGWMLAYFVMPAVASLVAARDARALDRVKYDGTRLHVGLLLPIALLAWIYAGPFLAAWLGAEEAVHAPLLRLFLVATVPLVMAVPVQAAFGMNRPEAVALAALGGSLVNLPLSYVLTVKLGVSGVIWGTVLTTLFSNLLVPGIYVFRVLEIRPRTFLTRTLGAPLAGAAVVVVATWLLQTVYPLVPSPEGPMIWLGWLPLSGTAAAVRAGLRAVMALLRWLPLVEHLIVGCLAYAAGYLAVPSGRADLVEIAGKLRRRAS